MPSGRPGPSAEAGEVARLLSYIALLAAAVALWFEASGLPTSRWEVLGASAFPRLVLGTLAMLTLVAIADSVRRLGRAGAAAGFGAAVLWWIRARRLVIFLFVGFAVYLWLIPGLGFAPATLLFLLLGQSLLAPWTWRNAAVAAVIAVVFSYGMAWLFAEVFSVFLPRGRWW